MNSEYLILNTHIYTVGYCSVEKKAEIIKCAVYSSNSLPVIRRVAAFVEGEHRQTSTLFAVAPSSCSAPFDALR